jgi:transcriptional regulator with XRE-family HTH domain
MMLQRITFVKRSPENACVHNRYIAENCDPRDVIKTLLKRKGLTARRLALDADISQPSLSRYLQGKSDTMEMPTWRALAARLEVTVSQLLGETPLTPDGQVEQVVRAMERLPEIQRTALVAAATAMASAVVTLTTSKDSEISPE